MGAQFYGDSVSHRERPYRDFEIPNAWPMHSLDGRRPGLRRFLARRGESRHSSWSGFMGISVEVGGAYSWFSIEDRTMESMVLLHFCEMSIRGLFESYFFMCGKKRERDTPTLINLNNTYCIWYGWKISFMAFLIIDYISRWNSLLSR